MRQVLHLVIVNGEQEVLAGRCGRRWLLPIVSCAERVRALLTVDRWCRERGLDGDVAGQWLGRLDADNTDWLVPVAVRRPRTGSTGDLEWTPLPGLAASGLVVEYQRWAFAIATARGLLAVCGPFGNLRWHDEVRAWIATRCGAVSALLPFRVTPQEVVLGADTADGRVYFKGLTGDRVREPTITGAFAALVNDSFAPTLALERRDDGSVWWLTASCAGGPVDDAHRAAAALARVQRWLTRDGDALALPMLDLPAMASWSDEILHDSACAATVHQACADVLAAGVPWTWIPMDVDRSNILQDAGGAMRFIDVDDSFSGPAPLAMAMIARRWRDRTSYGAYERAWRPAKPVEWSSFEVAAVGVECWLGWQRLIRNVERGELHAPIDTLARRLSQRLTSAVIACKLRGPALPDDPAA